MTDLPPPPSGGQQPPQVVYVEQEKKSKKKGCLIGAVVALALLLGGCVASIALVGGATDEIIQEQQDQRAEDEALVEDNAVILRCEMNESLSWPEVDIEFTNPLDEEKGFISVEVNVLDPENVVVGSAVVIFENLGPGQKARGTGSFVDFVDGSEVGECVVTDGTIS